ncbi:MAG TPA: Fur family transcriptional regulator [Thermomicrobiales bacterium]|jgi:Fur family ferric uptake transcriptional regulator|nr:Fur family transcriptional regulator [Thermomicrobiales bacterium]
MSHHRTDWERRLTERGFRVTRQRTVVLDAVCAGGGHTTLEDVTWQVAQMDASIDRTTIARTLVVLAEVGIVSVSSPGGGPKLYEVVGHQPHHHLVCQGCGREETIDDQDLAELRRLLENRYAFSISASHLMLAGRCNQCR